MRELNSSTRSGIQETIIIVMVKPWTERDTCMLL